MIDGVPINCEDFIVDYLDDCFNKTTDEHFITFDVISTCNAEDTLAIVFRTKGSEQEIFKTYEFKLREVSQQLDVRPVFGVTDTEVRLQYIPSTIENMIPTPLLYHIALIDELSSTNINEFSECNYTHTFEDGSSIVLENINVTETANVHISCLALGISGSTNVIVNSSDIVYISNMNISNLHTIRENNSVIVNQSLKINYGESEIDIETTQLKIPITFESSVQTTFEEFVYPYFSGGGSNPYVLNVLNNSFTNTTLIGLTNGNPYLEVKNLYANLLPSPDDVDLGSEHGLKYQVIDDRINFNIVPTTNEPYFFTIINIIVTAESSESIIDVIDVSNTLKISGFENIKIRIPTQKVLELEFSKMTFEEDESTNTAFEESMSLVFYPQINDHVIHINTNYSYFPCNSDPSTRTCRGNEDPIVFSDIVGRVSTAAQFVIVPKTITLGNFPPIMPMPPALPPSVPQPDSLDANVFVELNTTFEFENRRRLDTSNLRNWEQFFEKRVETFFETNNFTVNDVVLNGSNWYKQVVFYFEDDASSNSVYMKLLSVSQNVDHYSSLFGHTLTSLSTTKSIIMSTKKIQDIITESRFSSYDVTYISMNVTFYKTWQYSFVDKFAAFLNSERFYILELLSDSVYIELVYDNYNDATNAEQVSYSIKDNSDDYYELLEQDFTINNIDKYHKSKFTNTNVFGVWNTVPSFVTEHSLSETSPLTPPSTPPLTPPSTPPLTPLSTPPLTPPLSPPSTPPSSPPSTPPSSPPFAPIPSCQQMETGQFPVKLKLQGTESWYTLPCGVLDPEWLKKNNLKNTGWDWSSWGCNSNTDQYGYTRGVGFIARQNCPISCGICDPSRVSYLFDIWAWNTKWIYNPLPQNYTMVSERDDPIPHGSRVCVC